SSRPHPLLHDLTYSTLFFFNATTTTAISTLSLHDALPISARRRSMASRSASPNISGIEQALSEPTPCSPVIDPPASMQATRISRSEEHTSELQSRGHLVCRLLLEKKKIKTCARNHTESVTE